MSDIGNDTSDALNRDAARQAIRSMLDKEREKENEIRKAEEEETKQEQIPSVELSYDPKDFDGTEAAFWEKASKDIVQHEIPVLFHIKYGDHACDVMIAKPYEPRVRGELPLAKGLYPKAWYQKVSIETNEYQFFKLVPYNMANKTLEIGGSYGRLGATKRDIDRERHIKNPFKSGMYFVLKALLEKNGYSDMSDILFEEEKTKPDIPRLDEESPGVQLYNNLKTFAQDALIQQVSNVDFLSEKAPYTKRQIDKAWKLLKGLNKAKSVEEFNQGIIELMKISPRKVDKYRASMQDFLAKQVKDPAAQMKIFADIIDREESLIRAMEAVSLTDTGSGRTDDIQSPFGNIGVRMATDEERDKILNRLNPQIRKLARNVYMIDPVDQRRKFDEYVKKRKIKDKDIKTFWHGSRNENWISIIKNSLMLHPNAVITGKMWGNGIYFAPQSLKSWGYTSYRGTKWAGGSSATAYMGLYDTAYGNPYFPTTRVSGTEAMLAQHHADCLHAKANVCGLLNDEVIFFNESAVCLKALVEFKDCA